MLPSSNVAELLAALQVEFATALPSSVDSLQQLWNEWRVTPGQETGRDLLRRAHSLSGSGGTYGLPEISRAARDLELCLQPLIVRGTVPNDDEIGRVDRLVRDLCTSAHAAAPRPILDR